jgi:hypothetical protein
MLARHNTERFIGRKQRRMCYRPDCMPPVCNCIGMTHYTGCFYSRLSCLGSCSLHQNREVHTDMCPRTLRLFVMTILEVIHMKTVHIYDISRGTEMTECYCHFQINTVHM